MKKCVIYVHGKGGSALEAEHYKPLFEGYDVFGLEYDDAAPPWENKPEIFEKTGNISRKYRETVLIANSIGAFFSMDAGLDKLVSRAFFISPVVDMEKLITGMMSSAGISEDELREKESIRIDSGQVISRKYLEYVREHPLNWNVPACILYGSLDDLTSLETVSGFAERIGARLTVMEGCGHWFHTEEQMTFLDECIKRFLGGKV
ncbi:MAG: alpha/beta hydrolase [Clostridia bacterium]|nr:alpha/beta hydrolase [Clostridia bacterium]